MSNRDNVCISESETLSDKLCPRAVKDAISGLERTVIYFTPFKEAAFEGQTTDGSECPNHHSNHREIKFYLSTDK